MSKKQYIYSFASSNVEKKHVSPKLLGSKGASLAQMCLLGLPVPPGFTISTDVCNYFLKNNSFPSGFNNHLRQEIAKIESITGKSFGGKKRPLLFSVRSGAQVSMPGMMETVLNVGLCPKTLPGLAKETQDEKFSYDSYRRLITMYSDVVMDKGTNTNKNIREILEKILAEKKSSLNVLEDSSLSVADLQEICSIYKSKILSVLNHSFPDNPHLQLTNSIKSVFLSWNGERAKKYRKIEGIPQNLGTAVTVQCMVFGNMGNSSATGVAFTRNPSTGHNDLYGEWLLNAQGEDVVAGTRTPLPINNHTKTIITNKQKTLYDLFPKSYTSLINIKQILENFYKDMQDIEFTIEKDKLWMLQTRNGKRNGYAAVKIGLDMLDEKIIDENTFINRLSYKNLQDIMHPSFSPDHEKKLTPIASGLPAGPGCAEGIAVFCPKRAQELFKKNKKIVLMREETSPEDIHGMHLSSAIVTSRGGMTSHAALVARGWGKSCVVGCSGLSINYEKKLALAGKKIIEEGDWISVNGSNGYVYDEKIAFSDFSLTKDEHTSRLLKIFSKSQQVGLRANADTPEDAINALKNGAKGIGLCRTEHMFFDSERIKDMRKMIIFKDNLLIRKKALKNLQRVQQKDFYLILKAMSSFPVTIRLLDPPLHEFLPNDDKNLKPLLKNSELSLASARELVESLRESNPMLGHRGCRLGISYPEITEMQVSAIFHACISLIKEGFDPRPEIMVPLVGSVGEFVNQKNIINHCYENIAKSSNLEIKYLVGTMIELPRACLVSHKIAEHADFLSFGTNDLTQTVFGFSRDDVSGIINNYITEKIFSSDPFQTIDLDGVGSLVRLASEQARAVKKDIKIGICGEHGGDPDSILFFRDIGLDYVSCSPFRLPIALLACSKNID